MYQKIMVPLDGSELAESVLPHVEALSSSCQAGGIILVRVVEPVRLPVSPGMGIPPGALEQIERDQRTEAQEYLSSVQERLKQSGVAAKAEILFGFVADALSAYATANSVDLIVMATHGRSGVGRWVWGSNSDRILRSSCAPLLMVRAVGCPATRSPQDAVSTSA